MKRIKREINEMHLKHNWHELHLKQHHHNIGGRLADAIARGMGSWRFIIAQGACVAIWMTLNVMALTYQWDVYPFVLLNLLFSTQAAFAAPIIMMSQNRQSQQDRVQAEHDYEVNQNSLRLISINNDLTAEIHKLTLEIRHLTQDVHELMKNVSNK